MFAIQTYSLVHTARGKLSSEASSADHDLRRLVGHANFLDSLMLELAEVQQEHETWLNQFTSQASNPTKQRHIQWADAVVNDREEDRRAGSADFSDLSCSDNDHSSGEEVEEQNSFPCPTREHNKEKEFEDNGEEDYNDLALHRTQSHSPSPPDLECDLDDFSKKQQQQTATACYFTTSLTSSSMAAAEQHDGYSTTVILPQ
ncbi:hypothetical protein OIDMADRAFT_43274 [Oidiodendron maius Zn]|uniref:Uncharacterized protein n=1 Tax=Oidiodendron maius (strain Zn) TaxID=913774 RepID=A0A0C3CK75_OIDMZ|nr:hypothetical protein OIDMADRAFT_43274 [Oidiodendron maius Zn]